MEQPIAYGERMVALAKRILGDSAADEQVADLATAIRAAADALLLEKTDMAAAPPATVPDPAVEPLPQDSSRPEDRRRVLRQAKVRGEAKKLLAGQLRRANLDVRPVYEDWDVDAEERDAKPKGAPRGRNAGTGEEQVEHKLAAAERKAAAAEGEAPPPTMMKSHCLSEARKPAEHVDVVELLSERSRPAPEYLSSICGARPLKAALRGFVDFVTFVTFV